MRCIVPFCGQAPGTSKPSDCQWMNTGFSAAGDHDIGIAIRNEASSISNCVSSSCARCCCCVIRTLDEFNTRPHRRHKDQTDLESEAHRDMASGEIDQKSGNEERRNLLVATFLVCYGCLVNILKASYSGSDVDALGAVSMEFWRKEQWIQTVASRSSFVFGCHAASSSAS